mmetsp:Transcript_1902/g.5374  ORF Transcript_1902/g.5374 Transcript_1902/m.5374 type:complete len:119 (+) Transcript_1902:360-716(+)
MKKKQRKIAKQHPEAEHQIPRVKEAVLSLADTFRAMALGLRQKVQEAQCAAASGSGADAVAAEWLQRLPEEDPSGVAYPDNPGLRLRVLRKVAQGQLDTINVTLDRLNKYINLFEKKK